MSLFDFFFPEQAQAMHLRELAQVQSRNLTSERRQQYEETMQRLRKESAGSKVDGRVAQLQQQLDQAVLVIEALIAQLEAKGLVSREEVKGATAQIDAADGVTDGRITPASPEAQPPGKPFAPRREWPGS